MIENLEVKEWLEFNAKLQQKKNELRKELKEKGVLKKGATNEYDKYNYFSEAQYKELFTELFSKYKLELKFNELEEKLKIAKENNDIEMGNELLKEYKVVADNIKKLKERSKKLKEEN